jgi:menaquinone-dependent protoporphyrinogen oxidase
MKVLVAYASRHGATQGIAERIGAKLEESGLDVTIRPVQTAPPLEEYDAFVIGSAAYMGGWLGDATSFVRRGRDTLVDRPVWLFSSGPVGSETIDAKGRDVVAASEPKEFGEFARTIRPRGQRVFFGAYNPDSEPKGLAEGLMAKFMRVAPAVRDALPAGDFRDWPAIEAWAEEIARDLAPVLARA